MPSLILTGLLTRSLSPADFGVFAVLSSLTTLSGSLDFGLGNGLRNRLAQLAVAQPSGSRARTYFFSSLYVLLALGVVVGTLLLVPGGRQTLLSVISGGTTAEVAAWRDSAFVAAVLILVSVPLSLAAAGFLAYRESHVKALFDLLPGWLALGAVFIAVRLRGGLPVIVSGYFGAFGFAMLTALVAFLVLRRWRPPWLAPSVIAANVREMASSSLQFWALGLLAAITVSTSTLAASRVLGFEAAGNLSIVLRLASLLVALHLAVVTPFWTEFARAAAESDWQWAQATLRRMVRVTVSLAAVGAVVLVFTYRPIVIWWTGRNLNEPWLAVWVASWAVLYAWSSAYSIALNGFGLLGVQLITGAFTSLAIFPLASLLGSRWGESGVAAAYALVLLPSVVANPLRVRRFMMSRGRGGDHAAASSRSR